MGLKRRIPLLRWSVWRMAAGVNNITTTGQIGDGREAATVEYVLRNARAGDIDNVLATIDCNGTPSSTRPTSSTSR